MSCVEWFGRLWFCFSSRPWPWCFLYSVFFNRSFVSVNANHGLRISMWSLCFLMGYCCKILFFSHHWFAHDLVSAWLNLSISCNESWSNQLIGSHCLDIKLFMYSIISDIFAIGIVRFVYFWYRIDLTSKALGLSLYTWYLFINLGYSESIPRIQATSGLLLGWDSCF